MHVFKISRFITLKLIENKTIIFVNKKEFKQCKYLLLDIPLIEPTSFDGMQSIDEMSNGFDNSYLKKSGSKVISPKVEFWGHCSNMQVWVENKYDTKILHKSIAFPLLKELADIGDHFAKLRLTEEIIKRCQSNYLPVIKFLIDENYIDYLNLSNTKRLIHEAFSKRHYSFLRQMFRTGYFNVFSINELKNVLSKYYDIVLGSEESEIRDLGSRLFQSIALEMIKFQFPSKDELHFAYDTRNYDGNIVSLELRNGKKDIKNIYGLKYLVELRRLKLSNLSITQITQLEKLNNLEFLSMKNCNISKINGLESLSHLKNLNLSFNSITKIKGLENLTHLEILTLYENNVEEIEKLDRLTELKELDLSFNKISKLSGLENCINLEELRLKKNKIGEIRGLHNLRKLRNIDLGNNKIREITGLENLKELRRLDLSYNMIEEIKGLDTLKKLDNIKLSYNNIRIKKELKTLTHTKFINLVGNPCENKQIKKILETISDKGYSLASSNKILI